MSSEAQARITINKLLEEAGWRFLPDADGRRENIVCEHRVKKKVFAPNLDLGADFEHAPDGFVDYVLLNTDGRPVAVVEAKRECIEPLSAKEQARNYAAGLGVSHIFLSNSLVHYYWNLRQGNPVKVARFLPLEELGKAADWQPDSPRLAAVAIDENYIAVSQDSAWLSYTPAERAEVGINKKICLLRDYQIAAILALQQAALPGRHRFLFEMATGTGKTLLSAAIAKLYLRTENAHRILFLVDRLELEHQAWKNFRDYLANDGIETVIYKQKRADWNKAQVVVTTIQSLATKNRFLTEFAPTDFQLIISDEAHRTISGNNRAIFEYFVGAKLGLTATPKDYLKGVSDEDQQNDPRAYEKRLLLDTYRTFGSEDGVPTFRYSLLDAVKHTPPYLVNPITFDARTEITTQMLADGYLVKIEADEDGQETELVFKGRDFERKFFSDETNLSFVRGFLDHAKGDPLTGEIGKTICFAVSRRHATKLVTHLNEEATRRWPDAYGAGSTFAVQVTSDQPGAQQMTLDFANNNLNGKSKWRAAEFPDYDTSRTRVCVTVGMMTTGYDCEDVLNVVLARPIFSPTDFIQIKGRGTRLHTFKHAASGQSQEKIAYGLFDFFATCEFFEKEFDYDRKIELPHGPTDEGPAGGGGHTGGGTIPKTYTNTSSDPLKPLAAETVGVEGMRIDREMYHTRFSEQAHATADQHPELSAAVSAENWAEAEALAAKLLLNKPDEFWDLIKLQAVFRTDRNPSLREILKVVFGFQSEVARREQLASQNFDRFVATQPLDATRIRETRQVFFAYVLDPVARGFICKGEFAPLRAHDAGLYQAIKVLGSEGVQTLIAYILVEVSLNDFGKVA